MLKDLYTVVVYAAAVSAVGLSCMIVDNLVQQVERIEQKLDTLIETTK